MIEQRRFMEFVRNAWNHNGMNLNSWGMHGMSAECMAFLCNVWSSCGMHGILAECMQFWWNAWNSFAMHGSAAVD